MTRERHHSWPPKFDAIKIGPRGESLQARLENTDQWQKIDLTDTRWLQITTSQKINTIIQAWIRHAAYNPSFENLG